jgi:gluconolactonase
VAGTLAVVADSLDKPNGLAFSPDQRVLYLTDSGASPRIVAFDVVDGGRLARERLFGVVGAGFPVGIKVDVDGRVYASSLTGVQIFSPAGEPLGEIAVPRAVNFAWAETVLYITNDEAVWSAELDTKGA